jgi:hypothetical protein
VTGKHKLDNYLAHFPYLFSIGVNDHPVFGVCGTRGQYSTPLYFDHAHTARAVNAYLGMITESRQINTGLPDDFEQILFTV